MNYKKYGRTKYAIQHRAKILGLKYGKTLRENKKE